MRSLSSERELSILKRKFYNDNSIGTTQNPVQQSYLATIISSILDRSYGQPALSVFFGKEGYAIEPAEEQVDLDNIAAGSAFVMA
jgi:hypothetical protein